jgi:hypothetical protein
MKIRVHRLKCNRRPHYARTRLSPQTNISLFNFVPRKRNNYLIFHAHFGAKGGKAIARISLSLLERKVFDHVVEQIIGKSFIEADISTRD